MLFTPSPLVPRPFFCATLPFESRIPAISENRNNDRPRVMTMLIALCAATFFVSSAGVSTAPFINLITRDLSTTLPAVAHLFSIQALAWGIASLVAGMVSARFGQRAILVGGILLIGVMRLGFAAADTYAAAVVWQILSGIGGGAFMGIVYAASPIMSRPTSAGAQ